MGSTDGTRKSVRREIEDFLIFGNHEHTNSRGTSLGSLYCSFKSASPSNGERTGGVSLPNEVGVLQFQSVMNRTGLCGNVTKVLVLILLHTAVIRAW